MAVLAALDFCGAACPAAFAGAEAAGFAAGVADSLGGGGGHACERGGEFAS